jgi:hypothetical protein
MNKAIPYPYFGYTAKLTAFFMQAQKRGRAI